MSTLYRDDFYSWTRHQADLLRDLARRRDLPNDLDLELVAEEIEGVGREGLNAVVTLATNLLVHALKLASVPPESDPVSHWRREIRAFHLQIAARYLPSMRQHVDADQIWRRAVKIARADLKDQGQILADVAGECPVTLDDLAADRFDVDDLLVASRGT